MPREARGEGGLMRPRLPFTCFQSSRTGLHRCQTCGELGAVTHIQIHHFGYYCAKCCPACNPRSGAKD
jgi:hypothetical protein